MLRRNTQDSAVAMGGGGGGGVSSEQLLVSLHFGLLLRMRFWNTTYVASVMTRQQVIMEKGIITFKHNFSLEIFFILCKIAGHQLLYINVTQ